MVFNLLRNYRVFFIYQENIINIYAGFLQIYTQLFIYILKRNCIFFFRFILIQIYWSIPLKDNFP